MSNRVLPALFILVIVRKAFHDKLIDPVQGDLVLGRMFDSHCNESDVGTREDNLETTRS